MTAPIAPLRATSFEGLIFFVYDREAVTKEEDPPENAIVYFYPPSASIEDRISICGQLIGMSHFIHGFIGSRPALCKLQTEKVATVHSGKYTLALGGSLDEPDSLLIRQLETLHSLFTFYHGSLERIRLMCENQNQFLSWMNVIWDCYLHFVRHYGDFLPGVFDPLPFLNLSKNVAATCFTKASYILQACQRRKHILGGCILYSNSILCTQLEPAITERLILLKPNQSNHPARPVKTGHDLPFGVRILNAFLTLSEYLNLYDALAQSAYRQPDSPDSTGAFPDMYMTFSPLVTKRKSPGQGSGHKPQRISSDGGTNSSESLSRETSSQRNNPEANSTENVPSDIAGGEVLQAAKERKDSEIVHHREPILKPGSGVLSEKKYKDAQGVHEIAKETRKKQRFADISSLSSETRKSPAEHRKTTVEEMEKAFESRVDGLIAKNSIVEAEATTSLADKKSGQEQTGNEAGARKFEKTGEQQFESNESAFLARKKSKEEQHESTAIDVKAEGKIAGIKNGSVTSAFLALTQNEGEARDSLTKKNGEGKQNRSEASARKVEERTGVERNTSEEVVLDKTENNAGGTIDLTIYSNTSFVDSSCGRSLGEISWLKTVLNCSTAFDGSSCESCVSNDASLTMEAIEVSELKVIEDINSQFDKLSTDGSNSCTAKSQENEDIGICKLVLEEVITQVCEIAEKSYSQNGPVESDITSKSKLCCQACVDARKFRGFCAESRKSGDDSFQNSEAWEVEPNGHEKEISGPSWETDHSFVDCVQEKRSGTRDGTDSVGRICDGEPKRPGSAETRAATDGYLKKDHSLRGNLIKTPIVCESFSARNLNSRSPEKFVEKDFTCTGIEVLESERADSMSTSDTEVADGIPVAALENEHTERGNSVTWNSIATVSTVVEDGIPVTTPGLQEAKTNPLENVNSSSACSTEAEGENPVSQSPVSTEHDSEIHIANGHEAVFSTEGTGGSGNTTLKEMEDSTPHDEWSGLHSDPDIGEEIYEEEGDDINQVEGLTHVNLYVQAHSKVVLILLAEEGLNNDCNSIKALWETSLNQLGELEFLVKQSSGDETKTPYSDEYSFLVYDSFERTMKGNLNELVHQVDHLFCETTKVLHEQFENCSTLKDVMLRNRSSTVYGKRNLGRGTYFHLKGSYRALQGVPSHRDPFLKLEKKASKVLNKDHGVNVF